MTEDHAYGRVTNPGRFAPVQKAATDLIRRLHTEYECEVEPIAAPTGPSTRLTDGSQIRICSSTEAGCVTVEATDFPGVALGIGDWHTFHFPRCGCDACDEQLPQIIEEMNDIIDAFVGGRFVESVGGGRLGLRWFGPNGSSEGWTSLPDNHLLRHHPHETVEWPAWRPRSNS